MDNYSSDAIYQLIEKIATTAGKLEKQALVTLHAQDEQFKRVCEYTYNRFKVYGVAKRPPTFGAHVGREFDEGTWELLDELRTRKLTGDAAIEAIQGEMTALSQDSAELFWRIIKKDLRAGFSESTINKAVKGLIPTFPYMRCALPKDAKFGEWDWGFGVFSQEKADGMFANLNHEAGGLITITSRQGSEFPLEELGSIVDMARAKLKAGTQSHGEFVVMKGGKFASREISNGIMNSILSGGKFEADEYPVYLAWDQIPLSAVVPKGKHNVHYALRLADVAAQLRYIAIKDQPKPCVRLIDTRAYHSLSEAYNHYRDMLLEGKEGTVIKNPKGTWYDSGSSGSKDQIKLKLEADVDLKVIAIVPGKEGGKNQGRPGSLTCVTSCGTLRVDVTVKNEKVRDDIEANKESWLESILAVRANSILAPSKSSDFHSLFLPRMVEAGYRTDKTEPDSLEQVRDQFEAAIKAA